MILYGFSKNVKISKCHCWKKWIYYSTAYYIGVTTCSAEIVVHVRWSADSRVRRLLDRLSVNRVSLPILERLSVQCSAVPLPTTRRWREVKGCVRVSVGVLQWPVPYASSRRHAMTSYVWPASYNWHAAPPAPVAAFLPPPSVHLRPLAAPDHPLNSQPDPLPTRPPLQHGESELHGYCSYRFSYCTSVIYCQERRMIIHNQQSIIIIYSLLCQKNFTLVSNKWEAKINWPYLPLGVGLNLKT